MKTIVLGLDALDFRYLDRFEASLPNITALREQGIEAPLESTHPPWTGSAWPSMYTGTDPSYHGVYGFFTHNGYPDERSHVSRSDVSQPALWDYLSDDGARSIILNVPVTHPADSIDGVLVPGYLAAEDEPGHPPGIRDELSEAIGEEYTIYSRHEMSKDLDDKFAGYLDILDQRRRAAVALLEREEWEFAFVQLQKTDAVFHHYKENARFREIYEAADRVVGDIRDTVDDEVNIVLCSDHGIGPVDGYQIHINEILREHGFVETTAASGESMGGVDKKTLIGDDSTEKNGSEADLAAIDRALIAGRNFASRLGVEPVDIYTVAQRIGLKPALLKLAPASLKSTVAADTVDWRNSRAYCSRGSRMGIRINLADREPNGVISPAAYEDVRDDLIELLAALETPDGEPAFEFVCRREKLYDGPNLEAGPDIFFLPTEMNHTVSPSLYGRSFLPANKHDHKREGVFIGSGPRFSNDAKLSLLSLTDVAPITMGLLDRPVPSRMTGTVPDGLLTERPERRDYGTVPYGTGTETSSIDDGEVTDRLEDLGYL